MWRPKARLRSDDICQKRPPHTCEKIVNVCNAKEKISTYIPTDNSVRTKHSEVS
jgi:hypothetical protein